VVGEGVVDQIARPDPGGEQRAREPPVVGVRAFRLEDRPGRDEHLGKPGARRRGQAAERAHTLLALDQLALAQHRQAGERSKAGDPVRVDAGQMLGHGRGLLQRVAQEAGQGGQQLRVPARRLADLEPIVILAAGGLRHRRDPRPRGIL
jgi:hypothetical protein